jgi:hypothetical protein
MKPAALSKFTASNLPHVRARPALPKYADDIMPSLTDKAWSPYVAGVAIGLLQIPAFLMI